MKTIRRLLTLACALVAALAIAVPAYAANGPYALTIKSETPGHTYEAYQVFSGDVSAEGTYLSNVEWGDNVDSTALLTALKGSTAFGTPNPFANCDSAAKVAAALGNRGSEFMDAFAEAVGANLTGTAISFGPEDQSGDAYTYTATGLEAGYYLVQDAENSPSVSQYAKTKFILEVVDDVTAEAKADQPTLDKAITLVEGVMVDSDYANAAIGDTVTFQLTSEVPEMDGYNEYLFVVTDELSQGFTLADDFEANDVTVKIGDTALATNEYAVSTFVEEDKPTKITITINNLVRKTEDADITITYTATVNDKAVIGDAGNANTAYLEFSNDPNYTYTDVNDQNAPMGKTPSTSTYTYVGGLIIHKVDENNGALPGAQFKISSNDFNQVLLVTTSFAVNENGTYYKLKNGTYTKVQPTDENAADYVNPDGSVKYALNTTTTTETPTISADETAKCVTSWVDASGNLIVAGLSEGTYTITEVYAPDGYNIADSVTVIVGWAAPTAADPTTCAWTKDSVTATLETSGTMELIPVTIKNLRGATLPSTGGIGKTVLIGTGAVIAVVAVVGLVTKYRASRMD